MDMPSEYLIEEIENLTNPPFPWNGWYDKEPGTCTASQASTGDITVEILKNVRDEVCRKAKTIYYTTTKLCPAERGDGSPLFWYIGDTDEYFFNPDNEQAFVGRIRDEGWHAQDLKKLNHVEKLERLLSVKESYGRRHFNINENAIDFSVAGSA